MELQEVVVVAAELEKSQAEDAPIWPGGARLRRNSMTMAGTQVFEAMHGTDPTELNQQYPQVYSDWVSSSSVELPNEGDLLADRPVPIRKWLQWAVRAVTAVSIVATACVTGLLVARDGTASSGWRWCAWVSASLASWSLDKLLFYVITLSIEQAFSTSQHVIYYLHGARQPGSRFLAAVTSLAIFVGLFRPFVRSGSKATLHTLVCLVIAAVGFLLAQVVTKLLAAHYHRQGYFDKLKDALRQEYYLMALSRPRGTRMRRKSWTEQMYFTQSRAKPKKNAVKLNETQLTVDDPKLLMSLEAVQKHVRTNKLKLVFDKCSEVKDEGAAKQLAFYIFWNVMEDRSRDFLLQSDIAHFLPEKDVDAAFRMLDSDGDGKPTWSECREAVTRIFKQRQTLTSALNDTGSIIGTLHVILLALIQVVSSFFYLLVWEVDVGHVWVSFTSVILAFTFVFGQSVRTAYENVVFLFMVHPFDVGDRLLIDGETHTVHKMKLSTTVLEQSSGVRVWYPNNRLSIMPIFNQTRAECIRDSLEFAMDLNTPVETFDVVGSAARAYIDSRPNDFSGPCSCVTTATLDPLKLRLAIGVTYSFNQAQSARLGEVRHGLIIVVTKALVDRGVAYTDPQVVVPVAQIPSIVKKTTPHHTLAEVDIDGEDDDDVSGSRPV